MAKILGVMQRLSCGQCLKFLFRVKVQDRSGNECPKWRRAWNRKLRQLKEAGGHVRRFKRYSWATCPECVAKNMEAAGVKFYSEVSEGIER